MSWATFWAIFSQTHPVTQAASHADSIVLDKQNKTKQNKKVFGESFDSVFFTREPITRVE
jgi:hypothetical protein